MKSRTRFADSDCIICTLEQSLTPAEKSLVAMGEEQRLRDIRMFFQYATEGRFCEVIEHIPRARVQDSRASTWVDGSGRSD